MEICGNFLKIIELGDTIKGWRVTKIGNIIRNS